MKVLTFIALAFASVTTVRAEVLYWMINEELASAYDYVMLYGQKDDSSSGVALTNPNAISRDDMALNRWETSVDGYENASARFYIELYSGGSGWVGSRTVAYGDLEENVSKAGKQPPGYYSGWTVGAVPEPTSGLMLLVGTALLVLRRKRA